MASHKTPEFTQHCLDLLREHRQAKLVRELLIKEGFTISQQRLGGMALAAGIDLNRQGEGAGRPPGVKDSKPRKLRSEKTPFILEMLRDEVPVAQIADLHEVSKARVYELAKANNIPLPSKSKKTTVH